MTERHFFYGTLRDAAIFALVVGESRPGIAVRDAWLPDHRCVFVLGEHYPCVTPTAGSTVRGIVVNGLDGPARARLAFFEGADYRPTEREVILDNGEHCMALVYVNAALSLSDAPWDFEQWQARDKRHALRQTEEWMSLFGAYDPDDPTLDAIWRTITATTDRTR